MVAKSTLKDRVRIRKGDSGSEAEEDLQLDAYSDHIEEDVSGDEKSAEDLEFEESSISAVGRYHIYYPSWTSER